jgi:hypothetical protein
MAEDKESAAPKNFYLTDIPKTRKALQRLINEFRNDEEADVQRFRAIVSAMRAVLESHKLEADLRVEERLDQLESMMEGPQ